MPNSVALTWLSFDAFKRRLKNIGELRQLVLQTEAALKEIQNTNEQLSSQIRQIDVKAEKILRTIEKGRK